MSKAYRFEIVRRFNGRFAWIFVLKWEDGRRRVLARSVRDYRTRAKAEKAIDDLKDAPIEPGGPGELPFSLPTTSFQIVSGIVPLIVDEFPSEFESSSRTTVQAAPAAVPAKPAAKPKKRAAARQGQAEAPSQRREERGLAQDPR